MSGGGTNLQALIDAQNRGEIKNGKISLVVSSNPNAYALERAKNNSIATEVIRRKDYAEFDEYDSAVTELLKSILGKQFISAFENRIINIHPSLIPSFCGEGYYGLRVHEEALNRGVKVTGATAHFVNEVCDGGPIIIQKAVEIQKRVMEQAEWKILPRAVSLFCEDKIIVKDNKTEILD